ncbi:MAG: hypothetical protein JXR07_13325 [Reichenbachiella sp.]
MRKFIFLLFCLPLSEVSGQEINLTGVFIGKGLYIQNPYNADSGQFCIQEIKINDKDAKANLRLTAINIPFTGFDLYTPVSVSIIHGDSCKPRIVNPDAILYHSAFKFDSLVINDSIMHWYTKGDKAGAKYFIEKLDVDRWDVVKELRSKGRFQGAQYVYFPEHDDGGNKYRIKYKLPNGRYLYSMELEHYHYPEGVSFSPRVVKDVINLSRIARYEIMNIDGEVILQGESKKIPLRLLAPGNYSIIIEGDEDTFIKK